MFLYFSQKKYVNTINVLYIIFRINYVFISLTFLINLF